MLPRNRHQPGLLLTPFISDPGESAYEILHDCPNRHEGMDEKRVFRLRSKYPERRNQIPLHTRNLYSALAFLKALKTNLFPQLWTL